MPPKSTAPTPTASPLLETDRFTADDVITASLISELSYDRGDMTAADVGANWEPLDLSLTDENGIHVAGNAAAVVLVNDNGTEGDTSDDRIAIGFRGTDVDNPLPDVVEYWTLNTDRLRSQYFNDLKPLVEEVLTYAETEGITDVLLTGHSLGGAAVTGAYDWLASPGVDYDEVLNIEGITFNSPITGLVPDAPVLEFVYTNDLIGGLLGQEADNVIDNIWYEVNPESVAPEFDGGNLLAWMSATLQAYTAPAHDIARFPDALQSLIDSPVYQYVEADDFLVIDASDNPVSLDVITALSADAAAMVDAADLVGVLGSADDDVLAGSYKTDVMDGADGNDIMAGNNGDDLMLGGEGDDTMFGGAGRDILDGEDGNDYLEGGGGKDGFTFAGIIGDDFVADWRNGETLAFTDYGAEVNSVNSLRSFVAATDGISVVSDPGAMLTIALDGSGSITFQGIETWDDGGAVA